MTTVQEYLQIIDDVIAKGKFKDNWQSLSQFQVPSWYRERRFGLFIHWGAYSVPAYETEWYPRLMYRTPSKSAIHHTQTYGRGVEYRHIVEQFKPAKFDAEEWVQLFKESGAKHIMPVGEHHDGVKMYDSELNKWNMQLLNGRDYMHELHDACDKHDIGFCISNHRAEHYWFFNGARKFFPKSEVAQNQYTELYGPAVVPTNGMVDSYDKHLTASTEFLEEWLATACEMIDKNKPIGVYFDWWIHHNEFRPYVKKFLAYYYNRGLEWNKEVCVFYKWGAVFDGCAIFDVERGQIDGVSRELWQNDTSIAKNSWGYTEGNCFKSVGDILRNMIEVFSKNGCYMLNVGPKSDGTICAEEQSVLRGIGGWLRTNGEAVYGSYPFEVRPFEGKKSINGAFKENKKFASNEYCFTARAGKIYIFPMGNKVSTKLRIKSLRFANENGIRYQINGVKILGEDTAVTYTQSSKYLEINLPAPRSNELPMCICVDVD